MKTIKKTFQILSFLILLGVIENSQAQTCAANFTYIIGANGAVTFTSTSANTTSVTNYNWNFGPASFSATGLAGTTAAYTYTANGNYFVFLTIFSSVPSCSSSIAYSVNITNATNTCVLNASFSYNNVNQYNGVVNFANYTSGTSAGVTYTWNYGDGFTGNTAQPSHTYSNNGVYTVTLTANNNYTTACISTYTALVVVNSVCNFTPSFVSSPGANGAYTFSSNSVGTTSNTSYFWDFGNNTFTSGVNLSVASQTYYTNGTYSVTLQLSSVSPSCGAQVTQTINVSNVPTQTCNLNANFTFSLGANGSANFVSTSTGTLGQTTYSWNFGIGSNWNAGAGYLGATGTSCFRIYPNNQSYVVTLTANNNFTPSCVSTQTALVTITNTSCNVVPNFTSSLGSNGLVNFNSTSSAVNPNTTFIWEFGDNNMASGVNLTTTSNTYTTNANYTVGLALLSIAPACTAYISQSLIVSSNPCNLNANFASVLSNSGSVNFNNITSGTVAGTSYTWNFGDGGTSNIFSPTHTYSNSGIYTVTLTANNNFSTNCVSTKTSVVIINLCNLSANFTHTVGANGMVNFNCTSTGTNGAWYYNWNFGDGFAGSGISPSHAYLSGGAHNVGLIVTHTNNVGVCSDTIVQSINITTLPCSANSNFSLNPTNTPQYWTATPSYPWNVTNAVWNWGDGSSSGGLYTSHNYSVAATYTVCLTVTVSCGSTASTCVSQYISKSANGESMNMISLNVVAPALIPTGINNLETKEVVFTISPNPSNGEFTVNMNGLKSDQVKISVYNLIGKLVYEANAEAADARLTKEIQTNNLSSGIYFIKATNDNNEFTKKIIINK